MKTKLVLWGSNSEDERLLIALELRPKDNKINIFTFPEDIATEAFSQQMLNEWRYDKPIEFPEPYTEAERLLSVSESMLPDDLKVEREDILQRAQTEWHFIVLSSKLNESYQLELNGMRERIEQLDKFDTGIWEELKAFWDKVQTQVRDRNLFRDHANELRDKTNELFTQMKVLRAKLDEEFHHKSKENHKHFHEKLEDIENRVAEGLRLKPIFEELKVLQREFRKAKLTRDDRSNVWKRLDAAFKLVKEKRFGSAASDDRSPLERLKRRYDGLLAAIAKMERSIKRDEDDLNFQSRKAARTDGQLEAQLRKAKISMIEERIRSKQDKLGEMMQTKSELENRMESLKAKEAKRQEEKRIEQARRKAQEKIAQKIEEAAAARDEQAEKLEKAAEELAGNKKTASGDGQEKKTEKATIPEEDSFKETLADVVETLGAIATIVGDSIEKAVEKIVEEK
jgi:Ni/Co efflux regulator RcnB